MGMLDGRVAVVTGSGRGIGRGIAMALAAAGAKVVVNDLGATLDGEGTEKAPSDQVVDEILSKGGVAVSNYGSVSDWDAAHAMIDQAVDAFGRIDILVNVAGILRDRMLFNMTEAEWDAVIAVHLKGMFNCTQAASVKFREQRYGRVISMSSVSALGSAGQPNYGAAKAGILGLTWSTANAMARYGVTCNAILPSGATRMIDSTPRAREEFERTGIWPSEAAKGTERDPDNVAPLIVYLASEGAAHVNGQAFHSWGFGYTLLAQPTAMRRIEADRRLTPDEIASNFDATIGANLRPPPGLDFGKGLSDRPADEWTEIGDGIRAWKNRWEEPKA
jgi:NAD(P)-dependent dehydrogenase (short-subunit alcohol dehydrogenase family)